MIFKKYKEIDKISFNCPKELSKKIDEISDFYFCSRTDVINEAIKDFYKKFKRKMDKINKEG